MLPDDPRRLGDDDDRNDAGMERLMLRVYGDQATANGQGGAYRLPVRVELTEAEKRALTAASHGLNSVESAAALGVSVGTIRTQLKSARRRLAAKRTEQAVAIALRTGAIK